MSQPQVNILGSSPSSASACLRLQSDLRSIRIEPPEVKIHEMFISLLSDALSFVFCSSFYARFADTLYLFSRYHAGLFGVPTLGR